MECATRIPYVNLAGQHAALKNELLAAVGRVLDSGHFVLGPEVAEFEKRFAKLCGVRYAVGVNSGTDAIVMALRALSVGPGDEVITVANSFVTSASAIVAVGAKPVFVDVRGDYTMDPALIEPVLTPRTKAILPVHLTGCPSDMDMIGAIAKQHRLAVIEDCAQAVYAEYHGRRVGSLGDVGCFSLHPLKTLNACGDGGVLTTNDPQLHEQFKILRNNGFVNRDECVIWSSNSRLDSIQAAMLLVKMNYAEEWTEQRRANARLYRERLGGLPQIQLPQDKAEERPAYHTFVIQADRRDELASFLAERGVDTKIHYPIPIHRQPVAKDLGCVPGALPVTERQSKRILSLPIYPALGKENIDYISQCIHDFYQKGRT